MNWTYRGAISLSLSIAFFMGVLLSVVACNDSRGAHPSVEAAFQELQAQPVSAVVAEVDGRPISLDELDANRSHEVSDEAALQKLIERELLVAEAENRGYQTRETFQLARKQAMVQLLLAQEVEAAVKADELDEEALNRVENALRQRVGHPPGLQASHLLVSVPPDAQKNATQEELKNWFAESQKWLAQLRDDLPDMPTIPDLYEVRDRYRGALPEPLEIHVNAHLIFPIDAYLGDGKEGGAVEFGQALPETWRPVVAEFGQAATDMAREDRFDELSDPVRSEFGWHLLMAEKLYPAEVPDAQQLRDVAAAQLIRQARHQELVARMTQWMDDASAQTFPQVIAEAHDTQH